VHVGGSIEEISKWKSYYRIKGLAGIKFIPHLPQQETRKYQCSADISYRSGIPKYFRITFLPLNRAIGHVPAPNSVCA